MSLDEDTIKDLVGMVCVIVVALAFLGPIVFASTPPLVPRTVAGSEDLRPISNVPPQLPDTWTDWGVKGCTAGNHAECVDDATPDANSTYLWKNYSNGASEDQHVLSNLTRADITITSVTAWVWVKINVTWVEGNIYSFGLSYPHGAGYGDCVPFWTSANLLTPQYTRYELVMPRCNVGIPWTAEYLDNSTFAQKGYGINYNMTVTSEGVTVGYTYVEYVRDSGTEWDLLALVPLFIILLLILIVVAWWRSGE